MIAGRPGATRAGLSLSCDPLCPHGCEANAPRPRGSAQTADGSGPGRCALQSGGFASTAPGARHGAGRVISRTAAKRSCTPKAVQRLLDQAGVRLLGAGIEENPLVSEDIDAALAAQSDLPDIVARERPED